MRTLLKYYMWGYQPHFQMGLEREAKEIFHELSDKLNPSVFLVGILCKPTNGSHPICVEPEECGIDVAAFKDVDELAKKIHANDSRSKIFHTNAEYHKRYHDDLKVECLQKAVQEIINTHFERAGKMSFVSRPVILDNYEVFVILQFEKTVYERFYSLQRSEIVISKTNILRVDKSLIDALVHIFLNEAINPLYKPYPGVGLRMIKTDKSELLRVVGAHFIGTAISAASDYRGTYDLFDICNYISALKYEGDSGIGKLILSRQNHPNLNILIKLAEPIPLKNHRIVRKLLEIASEKLALYTDGNNIIGFAKLEGEYNPSNEDLFIINFMGDHVWELSHNSQTMMIVKYTIPHLPTNKLDKDNFHSILKRIFTKISDEALQCLWKIVTSATEQKHGTLIIVSEDAAKEAWRLKNQSILIEPLMPDEGLIKSITSIDGAVLLDTSGVCHSIGVILDGMATQHGTPSRGARYNSAIRYVDIPENKAVAIIISEDGMVDLYPNLKPQIKKSDIEERLAILRNHISQPSVDYDTFRPIMNWFDEHRFYIMEEVCEELNKLQEEFYSKLKMNVGEIYIKYNGFKSNPDMNETYFF
ncbi:MAG: diadenylate cyclase [Candidatus Methanoperedens sp.]|nr:diadenylate cyclase [Candidatus Methanoperedens sp.]